MVSRRKIIRGKNLKNKFKRLLWKTFYSNWNGQSKSKPGYTVLVMVPGDLPVFLKIAIEVLRKQDLRSVRELLIIPDQITSGVMEVFKKIYGSWTASKIRLVKLKPLDQIITKVFNNPSHNNWLQFIRGIEATETKHILWHDADLFILSNDFLEKHYNSCKFGEWYVLGVSDVWDKWYAQNGFEHLVSTWEIMFEVDWARKFLPWQHHGHECAFNGIRHISDTTLLPQYLTPSEKIGRNSEIEGEFIHFNYTISTYRKFQNSKGIFYDKGFKILLIRLLIDLFDMNGIYPEIPSLEELSSLLSSQNKGHISYNFEGAESKYFSFRKNIEPLLNRNFLTKDKACRLCDMLIPFDNKFHFRRLCGALSPRVDS
jgi:hypothetical protein